MRNYHEVLTNASRDKKQGNHSVWFFEPDVLSGLKSFLDDETGKEVTPAGITRVFTYHGNTVCVVDDINKRFWLSHAGWFTRSTCDAMEGYKLLFQYRLGYENVNKAPIWKYERI